jgi:hypothetical protein
MGQDFTAETAHAALNKRSEYQRLTSQSFPKKQLLRVRRQLELLAAQTMDELQKQQPEKPDAQRLDRLASATARLSEVERQLAGRPMPGSLRPRAAKEERRRGGKSDLSEA